MSNANFSTRKLTLLGLLCAVSIALVYFIHFPIFPAAMYLEYDPADIPIFIGTFLCGPAAGLLLTIVTAAIQGLTVSAASGFIGVIMHIIATGSFVIVFGLITRKNKSFLRSVIGLAVGVVTMTAMMLLWNIIVTPLYLGAPLDAVVQILVPIILPFNLIKAGINGAVAFALVKTLTKFVKISL